MNFIEFGKSVISIVNGILILIIFLRRPFVKWWHRNIASKRKKIMVKIGITKKKFNCIEKNLISELEFDCPPVTMDNGSKKLFFRQYRFKIEALIYGTKFCNLFSNEKNVELTVMHNKREYVMFPLFIEREEKDTRILLISFKPIDKPPYGSIVKVNLPSPSTTEGFITSELLNLSSDSWYRIYREKIQEAEKRYKK